jgi:hypothetical protein
MGISVTTACWVAVTLLTQPVDDETLKAFVRKTRPGGPGWKHIEEQIVAEGGHRVNARLALKVLCIFLGSFAVWGSLFGIGSLLYGKMLYAFALFAVAGISMAAIFRAWERISEDDSKD